MNDRRTEESMAGDFCGISPENCHIQGWYRVMWDPKTIVALLALMYTGLNGYQSAMMAPTEVLARQHYENISGMLEAYGIR